MKRLLLLRHAKSSWKNPTLGDFDRPLNARGQAAAAAIGRWLAAENLVPDRVLCSAALRVQETWEGACEGLSPERDPAQDVKVYRSLYLATPARLLETIHRQPAEAGTLLLIAHNPGMANLVQRLAGPGSDRAALARAAEKYPTAALADFAVDNDDWSTLEPGGARLLRLVTPADLD